MKKSLLLKKTQKKLKEKANKKEKHPNQNDMIIYPWTDLDIRKKKYMTDNKLNYLIYYTLPTKEQLKHNIEQLYNERLFTR